MTAVSVIIPVHNTAAFVGACLDSLLAQDFTDVEIIAIDNASTDGSAAILADYAARDSRVKVIRRSAAANGPSVSRNAGLEAAQGEYIWFVDADDLVQPGALGHLYAVAREADADIVAFNGERFSAQSSGERIYEHATPEGAMTGEAWIVQLSTNRELRHYVWLMFCRRRLLTEHRVRFPENILHEDIPWVTETLLRARRLTYTARVLYRYRQSTTSITGNVDDAHLVRRIESYFTVLPLLRAQIDSIAMQPATRRCLQSEAVAQVVQVDKLINQLRSGATKKILRQRCRDQRFWQAAWRDALNFKRKRQLAAIVIRQWFG